MGRVRLRGRDWVQSIFLDSNVDPGTCLTWQNAPPAGCPLNCSGRRLLREEPERKSAVSAAGNTSLIILKHCVHTQTSKPRETQFEPALLHRPVWFSSSPQDNWANPLESWTVPGHRAAVNQVSPARARRLLPGHRCFHSPTLWMCLKTYRSV